MGKKKEEPFSLDQVKKEVKTKQKENTEMKNLKSNSTVRTILTVILTLGAVAGIALYTMFIWDMAIRHDNKSDEEMSAQVQSQVQAVVSAIKVEPSKE